MRPLRFAVTIVIIISITIAGLLLAACEAPGEGAKARAGYELCGPIIGALAQYYAVSQRYPDSLQELTPGYLKAVPEAPAGLELSYGVTQGGTSYDLTFTYTGPGMNVCTYRPKEAWQCHGYY